MKGDNPCHGCTERWVTDGKSCHSSCKHWLERRAELDAENAARRAAKKARNDATAFAIESARHTIREQNHSRKL